MSTSTPQPATSIANPVSQPPVSQPQTVTSARDALHAELQRNVISALSPGINQIQDQMHSFQMSITSRLNEYEGTSQHRIAQLQGNMASTRQDVGAITSQFNQLASRQDQASDLLRDLDQTISYQEDAIQLLTGRTDEIQQTVQATQTEMQQLRDQQQSLSTGVQQLREQHQSMGNSLQSQMRQILERLDRQPAPVPSNPWGFGSFGPPSSLYPGSQPFGGSWGSSAPQPVTAMDTEPTLAQPRDHSLGGNRSVPSQVLSPPTITPVSSTIEIIEPEPSAPRATRPVISVPFPATPQSGQSGSVKNLGGIMKSIAPEKFSGSDRDQDVEDWINQMSRFLRVSQIDETLQVDVAASCLTGLASRAWSSVENMRRQHNQVTTLDFLFETLRTSYGQIFPEQKLRQKLKTLRQISTVEQYARIFLTTVGQLKVPMSQLDQIDQFLQGLREP